MATKVWIGGAGAIPQVSRLTPANVLVGNTFTATINSKSITFVATAATVANVTAGLTAAIQASAEGEFTELTFADETTWIGVTAADGTPFTITSSATGGTATLTASTPTAASGPNSWAVAANWTGGVPVDGDDVVIDNSTVSILHDLDQNVINLASMTVGAGFAKPATLGLPARNAAGYHEYRRTHLLIDAALLSIGTGQGEGSGLIQIESSANNATINVYGTGSSNDNNVPAFLWRASTTGHTVNIVGGSVGIASQPGEVATVTTLRVGGGESGNAQVWCGPGLVLTTLNLSGGEVHLAANFTTLTMTDGTLTVTGSATATTLNVDGGTVYWMSSGTVTTLKVSDGGTVDYTRDIRTRTVTNCTLNSGSALIDTFRTVTWTNPIVLNRCAIADLRVVDVGTHVTIQVAAGA